MVAVRGPKSPVRAHFYPYFDHFFGLGLGLDLRLGLGLALDMLRVIIRARVRTQEAGRLECPG